MKTRELKDKVILNLANNCMGELHQLKNDLKDMKVALEMTKAAIVEMELNKTAGTPMFVQFAKETAELLFAKHGAAIAIAISFASVNGKLEEEIERILKEQFPGADLDGDPIYKYFVEDPSNVIVARPPAITEQDIILFSASGHRTLKTRVVSFEEASNAYESFSLRMGGQDFPPFDEL